MEKTYTLRAATEADAPRIWEIIQQAKAQMHREGRQQWTEFYPAPENITSDTANGYAYVLCNGSCVIAYAAVVFDGETAYADLDGQWLSNMDYVVVHRLAVAEEMKQKGIATIFMQEIEKLSLDKGVYSFKVDTNFDNYGMLKIFEKLGFAYCGEVIYRNSGHRKAYEKLL